MQEMIDRLREKPKEHRQMYAYGVAATVTIAVALVWLVTITGRFAGMEGTPASALQGAKKSGITLKEGQDTILKKFDEARAQFESLQFESLQFESVQGVEQVGTTRSGAYTSQ